jgi:hypothetical protein
MRLLMAAFFFEAGLVLLVVPWSVYWEQNYFVQALPAVQTLITNEFVRGAVSGLGLVNLFASLSEVWALFLSRRVSDPIVSISRAPAQEE